MISNSTPSHFRPRLQGIHLWFCWLPPQFNWSQFQLSPLRSQFKIQHWFSQFQISHFYPPIPQFWSCQFHSKFQDFVCGCHRGNLWLTNDTPLPHIIPSKGFLQKINVGGGNSPSNHLQLLIRALALSISNKMSPFEVSTTLFIKKHCMPLGHILQPLSLRTVGGGLWTSKT